MENMFGKTIVRFGDYMLFKVVGYDEERKYYIVRAITGWNMYIGVSEKDFEEKYSEDIKGVYENLKDEVQKLEKAVKIYIKYSFNLEKKVDAYKEVCEQLKYFNDDFAKINYSQKLREKIIRELEKGKRRILKVFHRYIIDENEFELFMKYCDRKGHIYGFKSEMEILKRLEKYLDDE